MLPWLHIYCFVTGVSICLQAVWTLLLICVVTVAQLMLSRHQPGHHSLISCLLFGDEHRVRGKSAAVHTHLMSRLIRDPQRQMPSPTHNVFGLRSVHDARARQTPEVVRVSIGLQAVQTFVLSMSVITLWIECYFCSTVVVKASYRYW